jgi:signal-transduction protein with cAMP-binding, CBS, and nucleotidyltransferase domain
MNPLIQTLSLVSPLSEEAQGALAEVTRFRQLRKNTGLLQIGNVSHHLHFIHQGLARVYYYKDAIDITDYFAIDNQFIGAVASLFTGAPSAKGIQLLEDADVYSLHIQDLEKLCGRFHEVERAGRRMAILGFLESQARLESIQFLSARERYEQLERQFPGLLNRAPLKYVASYLGITQVSLSRIRGEMGRVRPL